VRGTADSFNPELEKAGRVADFLELGELMCIDALDRNESCGGHFREESATPDGEAERKDDEYAYVAAWEYKSRNNYELHKEALTFEIVHPSKRNYK
jgi:succinate dehydrogenase / fumarate reductase, flavoprotein subunit